MAWNKEKSTTKELRVSRQPKLKIWFKTHFVLAFAIRLDWALRTPETSEGQECSGGMREYPCLLSPYLPLRNPELHGGPLSTALHLNYLPDPGFYKPLFHQPKKLEQTQRSKSFPCVPAESASSAQSTVVQLCKRQFNHSCKFYKWWLDHSPKEGSTTSAAGGRLWEWQPYLTVFWDFPFNDWGPQGPRLGCKEVCWPSQGQTIW